MADSFRSNPHQSGVTLVELLVVIVLIAVIAGFAVMQRGPADNQLKRQNAAQQLKTDFERARFDSVKRRAECSDKQAKVVVNQYSFVLWTDTDADGTPESSEVLSSDLSGQNIEIQGTAGLTTPVTVSFNQRGEASAVGGATTSSPRFLVCNGTCPDPPTNATANIVLVTASGTVNLLPGGSTTPTFGAPGGTAAVTDQINTNLLLPASASPCP